MVRMRKKEREKKERKRESIRPIYSSSFFFLLRLAAALYVERVRALAGLLEATCLGRKKKGRKRRGRQR